MATNVLSPIRKHNTVRLQRLSKTVDTKNSISQMSPKDTFKLAALNSIMQGVKHNDISFITGRELRKLRKDPETSSDIEFASVHENLKNIRIKFDNTNAKRVELEDKVNKLKEEIQKYKIIEDQFNSQKLKGQQQADGLSEGVAQKRLQFQEKDIERKVLQHIKDRHKKDKVFYTQRIYDLRKQLDFIVKQNKVIVIDGKSILQASDRTDKVCKKLLQQINQQEWQRNTHIQSVEEMIQQKRNVLLSTCARQLEMSEIAERAMQDKDESEKSWQKLLLAQKLVSKLLRDKMYRQMDKFNVVETAFKNIKISTGVIEANVFVKKFLNKQTAYGELLGKIAENETKIEQLQTENQQLKKSNKELQEQQKQLFQIRKTEQINTHKQSKELYDYEEKRKATELKKSKLKQWLLRNMKKFKLLGEPIQKMSVSNSLEDLMNLFKKYLAMMKNSLDNVKEDGINEDIPTEGITSKLTDKIFRVKTNSKRKNSMGEEIDVILQEEMISNPYEDDEAVDNSRSDVLKQNEKFMKMLKLKYEQIRRAKIEAMPKEKKKEPQKPKVVEPQTQ